MPRRGEKHHNAKLSDAAVREMRAVWERWRSEGDGVESKGYQTLAAAFNCNPWTARDIATYRTRRDA